MKPAAGFKRRSTHKTSQAPQLQVAAPATAYAAGTLHNCVNAAAHCEKEWEGAGQAGFGGYRFVPSRHTPQP